MVEKYIKIVLASKVYKPQGLIMIIVQLDFSCVFLCCTVYGESMVNLNLLEPYRNRKSGK